MKKQKKSLALVILLGLTLFMAGSVRAHEGEGEGEHEGIGTRFSSAKEIIENNVDCFELHGGDFEMLGEYYLEMMYPEQCHKMEDRLGGKGSERVKAAHFNIGLMQYAGDYSAKNVLGTGWVIGRGTIPGGLDSLKNDHWFNWLVKLLVTAILILVVISLYKKLNLKGNKQC